MNNITASTKELSPIFREILNSGGSVSVKITGNSMFPLFVNERDTLEVKKFGQYKKRDIIMYLRSNGDLVIHRIVGIKNKAFVLCGDNQNVPEYPIKAEQVLGKVVSFIRKGKKGTPRGGIFGIYSVIWCFNLKLRKPVLLGMLKIKRMLGKRGKAE